MKQVAIIEDSEVLYKSLSNAFKKLGYKTEFFNDGQEAIDKIVKKKYDIIISSLVFENISGYEIAESIRKSEANKDSIIIIMTSNIKSVDEERLIDAGIDFLLDKNKLSKDYILDFLNNKIKNIKKLAGKTVLVIDDSLVSRNFISANLKRHGFNTITTNSAENAMNILEENDIDIIALDIELDGMSGFDFAKWMRNEKRFSDIPIVAISGTYSLENIEKAFRIGIDEYLPKPFNIQKFLSIISSFFVNIDSDAEEILVLDDSETILAILGNMLKKEGYKVVKYDDPDNAYNYLKFHTPNLIITDFEMPKMNGVEFIIKCKNELENVKNIPIIFLTIHSELYIKKQAYELGIIDYISKPFDSTELLLKVNSTLKRHKTLKINELEKDIEIIRALAATMAHYINNSLGGILGNAEILSYECNNEKALNRLKVIIENSHKINKVINSLQKIKELKYTDYVDSKLMLDIEKYINES